MIETERLILRPWREADKPVFHDLINTPPMMTHFGGVQPRDAIDALVDAQRANQADYGFSMWAVDARATGTLAGICGLRKMPYPDTPLTGELEAGWRIGERHWGTGVAREAAQAAFDWGWANTDVARIVAYTNAENDRSWGLMLRLGMTRREELDFVHPKGAPMVVHAIDRPA